MNKYKILRPCFGEPVGATKELTDEQARRIGLNDYVELIKDEKPEDNETFKPENKMVKSKDVKKKKLDK